MVKEMVLLCCAIAFVCPKLAATERDQLEVKANQGDASAQARLGGMYAHGINVPKDEAKGIEWYKKAFEGFQKAAAEGDASAQWYLGWLYQDGLGTPKDETKAAEWFQKAFDGHQKAAAQGDAKAQFELGKR